MRITTEFGYLRGRTDVVAVDRIGNIIAFEMKLEKWTQAMHQAHRNTCFAHHSYVVLPESTAHRAQRSYYEFSRRSVGICYVKDGKVVITLPATHQIPIQPWLSQVAVAAVKGVGSGEF